MGNYKKLWWVLIATLGFTFAILGYFGTEVYREAPPIPDRVVSEDGATLMTRESILDGQTAWQSVGGMQVGSIWGHGGVYGFLALGFVLLILRYIRPHLVFDDKLMRTGFWWLNGGLVLMLFTSLLPAGLIQFAASASEGMWYARSEEFMQQPLLETLRWIRTIGDVVFIIGALAVAWQVVKGLFFDRSGVLELGGKLQDAADELAAGAGGAGIANAVESRRAD